MANSKIKKLVSTTVDAGDGVFSTVTVDDEEVTQDILDNVVEASYAIAPRLWQCALRHKEEFNEEDRELIKIVCDSL